MWRTHTNTLTYFVELSLGVGGGGESGSRCARKRRMVKPNQITDAISLFSICRFFKPTHTSDWKSRAAYWLRRRVCFHSSVPLLLNFLNRPHIRMNPVFGRMRSFASAVHNSNFLIGKADNKKLYTKKSHSFLFRNLLALR